MRRGSCFVGLAVLVSLAMIVPHAAGAGEPPSRRVHLPEGEGVVPQTHGIVVFEEDFDADDGGFTASGAQGDWEWGEPTVWPNECAQGTNCWATNLSGNYSNNANEVLSSIVFDFTAIPPGTELLLTWEQAWHIESATWDGAYAEISIDGGAWTEMWAHSGGTIQVAWTEMMYDISAVAGQTAQFRWRLTSDGSVNYHGYYVDHFRIWWVQPPPGIDVDPTSMASAQPADTVTQQTLTISNTGGTDLEWEIEQEPVAGGLGLRGGMSPRAAAVGDTGDRSGTRDDTPSQEYISVLSFSEGFEDIDDLPGWFMQNNSSPLGISDWFQGNTAVFNAHAGPADSYIGANFNNTSGVGTISNWLLTPEVNLADGDTFSFWTRTSTDSIWADRLELRLSLAGGSTNVGSAATDVGDFTTLLLSVNPDLISDGYPDTWTQYSVTLSGIPAGASGRFALRYFVTDGGPSGSNSNYIGIDTVEFTGEIIPDPCDNIADVPWLSVTPEVGTTAPAGSTPVTVGFDSTGLAVGLYEANLCVFSNDPDNSLVVVPVEMEVTAPPIATVTVEVGPDGGGTVSGGGVYDVGDEVTVQAFPAFGWVFLYWEINGTEITDNPYTFVVTEDITLTAVFEQQEIEAIPTMGMVGLVLLLALLAGVGVFVLRRM